MDDQYPRSWRINTKSGYLRKLEPPESRQWYKIYNKAGNTAEIYVYDEIGYRGVTAAGFVAELQAVTAPQINLRINSPGGETYDALAIYEALRRHPARITTHIDALAASAASFIALAGDRRVIGRNAEVFVHDAWGLCVGNEADMRELAGQLDRLSNSIAGIYARRTGRGTVASWRQTMRDETWYGADEAIEAGFAHEMAADNDDAWAASVLADEKVSASAEWTQMVAALGKSPRKAAMSNDDWARATAHLFRDNR